MAKDKTKGPQFVRFFGPVIDALKELGGSGRPAEVKDLIAQSLHISEQEQNAQIESGQSRFSNRVDWARFYLAKAGYIDSSERGVWSLTEIGLNSSLSHEDALQVFQYVRQQFEAEKADNGQTAEQLEKNLNEESAPTPSALENSDYRSTLLSLLRGIPPSGFERFCQRLLRESGFQQVTVTGRSGDGGLDGHGVLQVNPFVSFQVYFQCKRYSGSVTPSIVRDFRGAMMGRADKGIILTTGTFTSEARKEAIRDGAPPIELVDGEKLLDMLERLQLGLKPKTIYEIDDKFFEEFRIG